MHLCSPLVTGPAKVAEVPLLVFAVRETPQESLGFSPCDLVFGHTVRSPLGLFKEKCSRYLLQSQVYGPYVVEKKISDTDYVVQNPDRKRKNRAWR